MAIPLVTFRFCIPTNQVNRPQTEIASTANTIIPRTAQRLVREVTADAAPDDAFSAIVRLEPDAMDETPWCPFYLKK
jgi:hypothetical protein